MIQCKECGFSVNEMMRFALMKNVCPSCGSSLLSGRDADFIAVIQSKVASQRFSSSLTENQLYDISLFLFNELKYDLGDIAIQLKTTKKKAVKPPSDEDSVYNEDDSEDVDLEDIRQSVAAEILGGTNSEDEEGDPEDDEFEDEEDEDIHTKAERLRKLHQQRISSSPQVKSSPAKALGGSRFKGVSRTT